MNELEDRNRELEAAAAAAALESLASPSATTPQRPVPSRAKGSDKENTGSTQMNARRAVKVLHAHAPSAGHCCLLHSSCEAKLSANNSALAYMTRVAHAESLV